MSLVCVGVRRALGLTSRSRLARYMSAPATAGLNASTSTTSPDCESCAHCLTSRAAPIVPGATLGSVLSLALASHSSSQLVEDSLGREHVLALDDDVGDSSPVLLVDDQTVGEGVTGRGSLDNAVPSRPPSSERLPPDRRRRDARGLRALLVARVGAAVVVLRCRGPGGTRTA